MPVYKNKGDRYDPNNHRGIILLRSLCKLFSRLSLRISKFLHENNNIGSEPVGSSPDFSTVGHTFTLHVIIEYKSSRVYCALLVIVKRFT